MQRMPVLEWEEGVLDRKSSLAVIRVTDRQHPQRRKHWVEGFGKQSPNFLLIRKAKVPSHAEAVGTPPSGQWTVITIQDGQQRDTPPPPLLQLEQCDPELLGDSVTQH